MDQRKQKVAIETDLYRVHGEISLPSEGYRSRISDHLNREDLDFFTVTDATVTPLDGSEGWGTAVLMLGRRHIRLLVPDDG